MNAQTELERKRKRCDEGREAMKARGEWHSAIIFYLGGSIFKHN